MSSFALKIEKHHDNNEIKLKGLHGLFKWGCVAAVEAIALLSSV